MKVVHDGCAVVVNYAGNTAIVEKAAAEIKLPVCCESRFTIEGENHVFSVTHGCPEPLAVWISQRNRVQTPVFF